MAASVSPAGQGQLSALVELLSKPIDLRSISPVNPHFKPLPGSVPIPIWAALLPPLSYYFALTLLPPFSNLASPARLAISLAKFVLAAISVASFASLPFLYYVPDTAIFTYQLGLVGCFGAGRCFDIFFLSWPRVPRRIQLPAKVPASGAAYPRGPNETWPFLPHPQGIAARLWWALDLMISMRGAGWDFATPDVRHDIDPWQPPGKRQLRRAFFKLAPVLAGCILGVRLLATRIDLQLVSGVAPGETPALMTITSLPPYLRPVFVALVGISLYALFDFGYTLLSAIALPIFRAGVRTSGAKPDAAHNVDFFPLLNPVSLRECRSVRNFWSKAWHRLFHRAFLIYGALPWAHLGLQLEYIVLFAWSLVTAGPRPARPYSGLPHGPPRASAHPDPGRALPRGRGDWAKVFGAFFASGVIHAVSERAALGGRIATPHDKEHAVPSAWSLAWLLPSFSGSGELLFFVLNGVAVIVEAGVGKWIRGRRLKAFERKMRSAQQQEAVDETSATSAVATRSLRSRNSGTSTAAGNSTDSDEEVKQPGDASASANTDAKTLLHYPRRRDSHDPSIATQLELELRRPYDVVFQVVWTLGVLLTSGELFVEGWLASGLVHELAWLGGVSK